MNEQIKNIIANNTNFLIASDKLSRPEIFFAREALRLFLEKSGKNILIFPDLPRYFSEKFAGLIPARQGNDIPFKTSISIPKLLQVQEVCYEEDENNFSIVISSKSKIEAINILINELTPETDVVFLLSFDSDVEGLKEVAHLPPRERHINIVKNHVVFSKKVFDIAENLDIGLAHNPEFVTLLYAALAYETRNFKHEVSEEIFEFAKNLLMLGAAKEKISGILSAAKSIPYSHILGRALARTQLDPNTSSSWTFITKKDFEKSAFLNEQFVPEVLVDSIHENIPQVKNSLVLFEEAPGVRCFVYSGDKQVIKNLAQELKQPPEGQYIYSGKFDSFTSAERVMRGLLKQQ